jgi:outer membrane protein
MKKWLLVVCIVAAAQVKAQQKLSLSDAIAIALKNSYDVELVRNQLSISTINNNPGVAGALPTVNLTASDNEQVISINQKFPDATRNTERNNVGSNILSVGVTGSILLYNGNRVVKKIGPVTAAQYQCTQCATSKHHGNSCCSLL